MIYILRLLKGKKVNFSSARREGVWRCGDTALPFWISALDGNDWSASRLCLFTPGEKAPGTHYIGSCANYRASLGATEKKKSPLL
jgi:hypothetical protein